MNRQIKIAVHGILNLLEIYRFPQTDKVEHIEFSVGESTIVISSPDGLKSHGLPAATPGQSFEINFKVDNVDYVIDDLKKAGVEIFIKPVNSIAGTRFAYAKDPDGNRVSLYENIS